MKKRLIILATVLIFSVLYGETVKIDIDEAVSMAYYNSYKIRNADIDLENSSIQVREAYKEALPKISYTGTYDKNEGNIYGGQTDGIREDNYLNRIELVQPMYRGGVIGAGIFAAKKIKERSNYEYLKTQSELRLLVIEKYLTVLKLYREMNVYKTSLADVEGQYKKALRKYELRLISKAEVLPFSTKVINTRTNIIRVHNEAEIAKVQLKNEIGIKGDTDMELLPVNIQKYNLSLINIEEDVRSARENNRDSKIAQLDYELTKANESVARAEFFPKIDFRFGYTGEEGDFNGSTEDWQWNAGVTIKMNLFEFGQNIDTYNRYKNETDKSKNIEERTKDDVEVTVRSNYLDVLRLEGTVKEQEAAVKSAEENYSLEKRRYEKGLISVIDFLQIEKVLRESELALLQSELDYYLAYERYKEYIK